jgi:hypothetical protein
VCESLAWLGLAMIAALGLTPLLINKLPITFVNHPPFGLPPWLGKGIVILGLGLAIGIRTWVDWRRDAWAPGLTLIFAVLAAGMTEWHWIKVDVRHDIWQQRLYLDILNHEPEPTGQLRAPHQFRALPYGFTRSLELISGDWVFACVAYRWFFTFWFLWTVFQFARRFLERDLALITLVPIALLYPLSIRYYWGQLTDPLSHALFVLAMIYIIDDRLPLLAVTLALGVLAKETAVVAVPAYWACYWRRGWSTFIRTIGLGLVCTGAFLAARLPLGWGLAYGSINGTQGLMIGSNLGIGQPLYIGAARTAENYLQPLIFVGPFLPFIVWNWRSADGRLRALFLTLTPLVLISNLCFGWMYESRNYVPLLPLLGTLALQTAPGRLRLGSKR